MNYFIQQTKNLSIGNVLLILGIAVLMLYCVYNFFIVYQENADNMIKRRPGESMKDYRKRKKRRRQRQREENTAIRVKERLMELRRNAKQFCRAYEDI